jgi:hypothetical protein
MKTAVDPSLFVIGLGVKIPLHTTAEARLALSACTRIYSIIQEPPDLWLPPAGQDVEVIDLMRMYNEGALRTENYERVAETIIEAVNETQCVGYVSYGNPLAYDSVAQSLVHSAGEAGLPFRVVAGISSIDTLLCDLGRDMAPGLQIYEASWLVAARIPLQTDIAVILLQLGTFGSLRTHYKEPPSPAALSGLLTYLGRFYPLSHQVFLVRSTNHGDRPSNIRVLNLGDICSSRTEDILNASMYIPALRQSRLDEDTLEKMRSF